MYAFITRNMFAVLVNTMAVAAIKLIIKKEFILVNEYKLFVILKLLVNENSNRN
jgi:hypothetical protein